MDIKPPADSSSGDASAAKPSASSSSAGAAPKGAPGQKRRRLTRACHQCRRQKIKCSSEYPCSHCATYGYECTYEQQAAPPPARTPYIMELESELLQIKSLLRNIVPGSGAEDAFNFKTVTSQLQTPRVSLSSRSVSAQPTIEEEHEEDQMENMIEATGQLGVDDQGKHEYYGHFSGYAFFQRAGDQLNNTVGASPSSGPISATEAILKVFDSAPAGDPSQIELPLSGLLPQRDPARELVRKALDLACALLGFIHKPTFEASFNRIYDIDPEHYTSEDHRFLPLLYSLLAVGSLFTPRDGEKRLRKNYNSPGFRYFTAARKLIDITELRDLTSLQTVVAMIVYLQSSSRISTCHSYISLAVSAAMRMGLHRAIFPSSSLIDRELRKRIFWAIERMDTYVGTVLGLPKMINDTDIDQEMPSEVDDDFITEDRILPFPASKTSVQAAANAHTRLLKILAKLVKYVYPVRPSEQSPEKKMESYVVSGSHIREIEQMLQEWSQQLPSSLRGPLHRPEHLVKAKYQLSMAYAHVQIMLYRPFLHYISRRAEIRTPFDQRKYDCAVACINVSQDAVQKADAMRRIGLLTGVSWFTVYTTFLASVSLIFSALANTDESVAEQRARDAAIGKKCLESLRNRSMAAQRCSDALQILWEQLPERLRQEHTTPQSALQDPNSTGRQPNASSPEDTTGLANSISNPPSTGFTHSSLPQRSPAGSGGTSNTPTGSLSTSTSRKHPRDPSSASDFLDDSLDAWGDPDLSSAFATPPTGPGGPQQPGPPFAGYHGLPVSPPRLVPTYDLYGWPAASPLPFSSTTQAPPGYVPGGVSTTRSPPSMGAGLTAGGGPTWLDTGDDSPGMEGGFDHLRAQNFGPLEPSMMDVQQLNLEFLNRAGAGPGGPVGQGPPGAQGGDGSGWWGV